MLGGVFCTPMRFLSPFCNIFGNAVSAVILVLDYVLNCIDHKSQCAAIFLDFSKTFNTIEHSLLIQKLSEMGLDNESCKWFKNYLTDRTQCVHSDGIESSFLDIRCTTGVSIGTSSLYYSYE